MMSLRSCLLHAVPFLRFAEAILSHLEFDFQEGRLLQYFSQISPAVTGLKVDNQDSWLHLRQSISYDSFKVPEFDDWDGQLL